MLEHALGGMQPADVDWQAEVRLASICVFKSKTLSF